jgi:hypothetical protein
VTYIFCIVTVTPKALSFVVHLDIAALMAVSSFPLGTGTEILIGVESSGA